MKSNRVNKKQPVKDWRSPLLELQELPKGFGWDRVANKTTPLSWHLMQQTGKLEEREISKKQDNIQILKCYVELLSWRYSVR